MAGSPVRVRPCLAATGEKVGKLSAATHSCSGLPSVCIAQDCNNRDASGQVRVVVSPMPEPLFRAVQPGFL